MSVDDLKARLRDIPGIETLTMQTLLGRQVFGFNGLIAGVDINATDQEIEDAIRNTDARERGRGLDAQDLAPLPTFNISPATPLPPVNITEPKPMTTQSPTGFVPGEISSLFKSLRDRKTKMVTELMANGAEFADILDTGEKAAAALKAESTAMKAEFGLTTNNPPD